MRIRRIVVRLDPAPCSRAVLDAAAALAARMEAELVGLFVENANLLHFAAFPFAHEVGFPSATRRPLDVAGMERSLRARANDARRALELTARNSRVRWSFEVTRGPAARPALAAVTDADLVIVSVTAPEDLEGIPGVRIVRAGDPAELRSALALEEPGILVLAGTSDALVCATLRRMLEEESG